MRALKMGAQWPLEVDQWPTERIWALKNWCFWTVLLERTLESLLDCKEIKPVNPKENQSWLFTGRTGGEAEAPILWPLDAKNWLTGKDPDAGKDWRQEEKGMIEDKMVGKRHRLNGHEFEQGRRVGVGQGSLPCCSPRDHKELDTTEQLNCIELNWEDHQSWSSYNCMKGFSGTQGQPFYSCLFKANWKGQKAR